MRNIKKEILLGILLLTTIALLFTLGCGDGEKKIRCDLDSDCPRPGSCKTASCEDGFCETEIIDDCCGNAQCEESENACSCSKDCKPACSGPIKVKTSTGKLVNSTYLIKSCDATNTKCLTVANPDKIRMMEQFNELSNSNFKFNIKTVYPQPFVKGKDDFQVNIELKYINPLAVQTPIIVKQIRVTEGTNIVASQDTYIPYSFVEDMLTTTFGMSYSLSDPEMQKTLQVSVEYLYTPLRKVGEDYVAQTPKLETYKYSITQKVYLLDPTLAED